MENDTLSILFRVFLAMVIGALIGIEREYKKKPAGIRTHMFVAGASTLLLLLNEIVVSQFSATGNSEIAADPTRIIQAIVVGISFIGAGTILKAEGKNDILYLTTAASILFTAAIGMVVGLGMYLLAISLTVMVVISLYLIGMLENKFFGKDS